jgi:hypothetical protein
MVVVVGGIQTHTVKLSYNEHGYNEFMATASKWQLHISFT